MYLAQVRQSFHCGRVGGVGDLSPFVPFGHFDRLGHFSRLHYFTKKSGFEGKLTLNALYRK